MVKKLLILGMFLGGNCCFGQAEQSLKDRNAGMAVDAKIRSAFPILDEPDLTAEVDQVGRKVLAAAGNPHGYDFTFRIVNDATPNAFSTAGGFVYVTSGLLQAIGSRDELAAVLGHEIAHVNERDPMKSLGMGPKQRMFWSIALSAGAQVAAIYAASATASWIGLTTDPGFALQINRTLDRVSGMTSIAVSNGGGELLQRIYRGNGKKREIEADGLAVGYISRAGYKASAMAEVFEKLLAISRQEAQDHASVSFLHSSTDDVRARLARIRSDGKPEPEEPKKRRR